MPHLFQGPVDKVLGGQASATNSPIKIGVIGLFSGPVAFNGGEMKKGMMIAIDEINAKREIFGSKIQLVFGDTEFLMVF